MGSEQASVEHAKNEAGRSPAVGPNRAEVAASQSLADTILTLQRTAGNMATAELVGSLAARPQPPVGEVTSLVQRETVATKARWDPPHFYEGDGLIPVTDHYQARNNLWMMALTLGKVADWGIPVARVLLDRVNQTRASLSEQGDLTEGEVSSLGGVGDAAVLAYISGLQQMHDTMLNSLSQYKMPEEFVGAGDRVAEMLHAAFGEDHSILSKAKHASEAFHRAEENLKYVIEWAEQGVKEVRMLDALGIMKARYWPVAESAYKHIIERWGEVLPLVVAIHGAMQAVWDSASAVSAAHDPSQTSTKQAAAGVEAGTSIVTGIAGVAAAVGIEAAGSFGFIWANTIVPQTQKALKALEHLDSIASSGARKDMQVWWHDAAQGGKGPPVIPKAYLAQNWFPGGQATLNYMWAIFRGEPPVRVPAEVTKFFYDARKKMNLEKSEGEQLKTEWHLFEENEVKNLREWVTEHKVEVWGMLYGSLPHP